MLKTFVLTFSSLQKLAMKGQDVPAQLRDPNNLVDLLPVVDKTVERLQLK